MQRTKTLVASAVFLVVFSLPGLGFMGRPGGPTGVASTEIRSQRLMGVLGLTDEQRERIFAREKDIEKEIAPMRQSITSLRSDINKELSYDSPNNARINDLLDRISVKMTEIQKKKISYMLWVRQQLTPEQKQKLKGLMEQNEEQELGPAR